MKLTSINSIIAKSVAILALGSALNATAGVAPAPVAPAPAEDNSIGAELSGAFDSRYYFRGLWFADNIVSTFLNVSVPLIGGSGEDGAGSLTWGIGAGYISTVETPFNNPTNLARSSFDYSEIDVYSSLSYDAGFATFGMQYQYYFYPDTYAGSNFGVSNGARDPEFGISGNSELGFTVGIPVGDLNIGLGYFYDFTVGGSYFQAAADYTIAVTDWLSIVPSAQVGYGLDYYTGNNNGFTPSAVTRFGNGQPLGPTSAFTHMFFSIAAPMQITKSATFTPYVAMNSSLRLRAGLNAQQNEFFWGAKVAISF